MRNRRLRRRPPGPGDLLDGLRNSNIAATTLPGSARRRRRARVRARGREPGPAARRRRGARGRRRGRRARAAGHDRDRPHPLGHARPRVRGERSPALRHRRPRPRRGQRDRRELHGAQAGAPGRGRRVHLGDRRGGHRAPDLPVPRRRRPRGGRPPRLRPAARPLRVRRGRRRRARRDRRRAQGVPAGRRTGRWRAVPRLGDPGLPRPHAPGPADRERRDRTVTADEVRFTKADGTPVERAIEEVDWSAEVAEKGGYETFMLKEIHEQAEAVAETIADRTARGDGGRRRRRCAGRRQRGPPRPRAARRPW